MIIYTPSKHTTYKSLHLATLQKNLQAPCHYKESVGTLQELALVNSNQLLLLVASSLLVSNNLLANLTHKAIEALLNIQPCLGRGLHKGTSKGTRELLALIGCDLQGTWIYIREKMRAGSRKCIAGWRKYWCFEENIVARKNVGCESEKSLAWKEDRDKERDVYLAFCGQVTLVTSKHHGHGVLVLHTEDLFPEGVDLIETGAWGDWVYHHKTLSSPHVLITHGGVFLLSSSVKNILHASKINVKITWQLNKHKDTITFFWYQAGMFPRQSQLVCDRSLQWWGHTHQSSGKSEHNALAARSCKHTKWFWMSWIVKALFPTPPPPTITSLYSSCAIWLS